VIWECEGHHYSKEMQRLSSEFDSITEHWGASGCAGTPRGSGRDAYGNGGTILRKLTERGFIVMRLLLSLARMVR
jgi:hypothetical protein